MAGRRFTTDWRLAASGLACLLLLGALCARADAAGETPAADSAGSSAEEAITSERGALADRPVIPDDEPADGTPPVSGDARRIAAYGQMLELLDSQEYAAAVDAAATVVELTEAKFGTQSLQLVSPLNNLATAQMLAGRLPEAETNYKRSIRLIERNEGILSRRLINAYIGLGATYNRAGLYAQAREAFERALRINHVNDGFYNAAQFKIRDGLTESYIGLQDFEEANFQQETQLEINARRLGQDNPDLAPAMYKLARWYERSGQLDLARSTYQSAQRLLRKAYGKNNAVLVDALEGIAGTYEHQGLMAESARALKRALRILEESGSNDIDRRANLLVRLGDLYTRNAKTDTAQNYYSEAWQLLSSDTRWLDKRAELFAEPQRIAGVSFEALRFGPGVTAEDEQLDDGWVLLRYDVDEGGRARNIEVIEAEPPDLLGERLVNVLARSRFRPRFADGQPVATEGLMYRHEYRYRPAETASSETEDDRDHRRERRGRLEYPDAPGPND